VRTDSFCHHKGHEESRSKTFVAFVLFVVDSVPTYPYAGIQSGAFKIGTHPTPLAFQRLLPGRGTVRYFHQSVGCAPILFVTTKDTKNHEVKHLWPLCSLWLILYQHILMPEFNPVRSRSERTLRLWRSSGYYQVVDPFDIFISP
jgi:hypothetical protein